VPYNEGLLFNIILCYFQLVVRTAGHRPVINQWSNSRVYKESTFLGKRLWFEDKMNKLCTISDKINCFKLDLYHDRVNRANTLLKSEDCENTKWLKYSLLSANSSREKLLQYYTWKYINKVLRLHAIDNRFPKSIEFTSSGELSIFMLLTIVFMNYSKSYQDLSIFCIIYSYKHIINNFPAVFSINLWICNVGKEQGVGWDFGKKRSKSVCFHK